jgi:hypothetical protein
MPITWKPKPAGLSNRDISRWAMLVIMGLTVYDHSTVTHLGEDRWWLRIENGHDLAFPRRGERHSPQVDFATSALLGVSNLLWRRRRV